MNCIACNYELRPTFRYCPMCGKEIENPVIEPSYDKDDYPDGFNPEIYNIEEPR